MNSNTFHQLGLLLLIISHFVTACQPIQKKSAMETLHSTHQSSITFLALGDSYTIGEGVETSQRWPMQLARRLREEGVAIADPRIIATTGWTTDELAAGIERAQIRESYGLVTLLIGVNNQYRGRGVEEYRSEFRALLAQAIAFADNKPTHVVVLSIPDWGVTPFATGRNPEQISQAIDLFNAVNRAESADAGVGYVDITPISRQAANDLSLLAGDQLHPSGTMYEGWVELLLPVVKERLQ